jgi:predicted ester cyclase
MDQREREAYHKALHRRVINALWNEGDLDAIDGHLDPDVVGHAQAERVGPKDLKLFVREFREAFPDLKVTIEHEVAEGDELISMSTFRGTHTGEFRGVAPTGRSMELSSASYTRFDENSRVVEESVVYDQLGMLNQLGLTPEQFEFAPRRTGT